MRDNRLPEYQNECGEEQGAAENHCDQAARGLAVEIEMRQDGKHRHGRRNAAAGKPSHHAPVDAAGKSVHQAAAGFGDGGI